MDPVTIIPQEESGQERQPLRALGLGETTIERVKQHALQASAAGVGSHKAEGVLALFKKKVESDLTYNSPGKGKARGDKYLAFHLKPQTTPKDKRKTSATEMEVRGQS